MNTWFLILIFAGNAQVIALPDRVSCETLKSEIVAAYGKGSSFQNAVCTTVPGSTPRK
ncbi:MAG: hypothetical protein IT521_02040 [Burkholderiales bacterium]|nr:hypothetical protein [Burkholderiales bacterium]